MTRKLHWLVRGGAVACALAALGWRAMAMQPSATPDPAMQVPTVEVAPIRQGAARPLPALFAAAAEGAAATGAAGSSGLTLVGVAGRLPDDVQVLIRLPDGRVATLSPGGRVGGWTVISAAADRAVVARDGQQEILPMQQ